jgi:hypothetical protein
LGATYLLPLASMASLAGVFELVWFTQSEVMLARAFSVNG